MLQPYEFDFLNFSKDKNMKKHLKDEIIYYSDRIKKTNDKGKVQDRNIIITDKAIYNFKDTTFRRRIPLNSLIAITVSSSFDEFIIHFADDEYDYHYQPPKKKKIIEIISECYYLEKKSEFELYVVPNKLKEYITTKKDKKNNKNFSKKPNFGLMDIQEYIYGMKRETIPLVDRQTIFIDNKILNSKVDLANFEIIKTIGRGSLGKILLADYKKSNDLYAIKVIRKDQILSDDLIDNILLEKQILTFARNEFILNLSFFFQNKERIYFITPFLKGGDLYNLLKKKHHLDEYTVKFYTCQIAIALEYLHSQQIIYRDLKPENILINDDGYLKLCDFGGCVHMYKNNKEYVLTGSPFYFSPEMINFEGYNLLTDWWSFGILIYELLYGNPPFFSNDKYRLYELICNGEIIFPDYYFDDNNNKINYNVSNEAKDIIIKLLSKKNVRIGKNGFEEIQNHSFFANVNFENIMGKKFNANYKPIVQGKKDLSNFNEEYLNMDINDSPIEDWIGKYDNYFYEFDVKE